MIYEFYITNDLMMKHIIIINIIINILRVRIKINLSSCIVFIYY